MQPICHSILLVEALSVVVEEATLVETMLVEADIVATLVTEAPLVVAVVIEATGMVEDAVEADVEAEFDVIADVIAFVVPVESLVMGTEDVAMTMVDDSELVGVGDWLDTNEGSHTCHIIKTRKPV